MGLDYTNGCVNFRDVGEWVNTIAGELVLLERRLLRGGKLDFVTTAAEIGDPASIISVRKGTDAPDRRFGADYWHFPISNDHEKYATADPVVRRWLNGVARCLAEHVGRFPVLAHCTSGKDRTGVVVAAVLRALGVERRVIVEEYLLSDGDVRSEWIEGALDGIGDPRVYFDRVSLTTLRERFLYRPVDGV